MTQATHDLHMLLLRLSGQVPDDMTTMARTQLAQGNLARSARTVALGVLERNVVLGDADRAILTGHGVHPGVLSDVDPELDLPVEYGFSSAPADPFQDDGPDGAAVDQVASMPEVRGLWRTWRQRLDEPGWPRARRVYLVEVDANPVGVTAALQRRLFDSGELCPQVEAYVLGTDVPVYQRLARADGDLLWARSPAPRIRAAALYDVLDPRRGPCFRPDHERIEDAARRHRLIDYLNGGEPLLVTTARMEDMVDPSGGLTVPVTFRTDGTWLWTDVTTYYLERHHLAPDPRLVTHIQARGFRRPRLDGVDLHRAHAALVATAEVDP